MTRVLLVGLKPEAADYSDPALPKGITPQTIQAGIDLAMKRMTDRGWQAEACLIERDATSAVPAIEQQLRNGTYDCVVIGAGVRLPPKNLPLFEAVINAVHRGAPKAAIAFNLLPEDTGDAAARWLVPAR